MARSAVMLSQVQLSERWGKAPRTVRRWTRAGLLPTFTDPDTGRVVYPLAAIERWEASHMPEQAAS